MNRDRGGGRDPSLPSRFLISSSVMHSQLSNLFTPVVLGALPRMRKAAFQPFWRFFRRISSTELALISNRFVLLRVTEGDETVAYPELFVEKYGDDKDMSAFFFVFAQFCRNVGFSHHRNAQ